jgi:hypothetical protein
MSQPVTVDPDEQTPDATAWDSSDGSTGTPAPERSVTVGDWTGDSSSRELPTEESLRRSLSDDPKTPAREFEGDEDGPQTAEEAVNAENARRKAGEAPEPEPEKKKSKPLATRVSEEVERLKLTRRERGDEERRLEAIRKEIADLEASRTKAPADGERAIPAEMPTWGAYDTAGKDFDEFLADRDAYIAAQATKKAEDQKRGELQRAEEALADRKHQDFQAGVATRIDAGRLAHEDFDEVIKGLGAFKSEDTPFLHDAIATHEQGGELMYFLAQNIDAVVKPLLTAPLTYPMMDALHETSKPGELLAYFAANLPEVERISRLQPQSALVALGRLIAQVESAPAGSLRPPAPVTKAIPPPAARVDGSRRVAARERDTDPDAPPGGWDTN